MPFTAVNILWAETTPADPDSAAAGAGVIRSLETSVRNGLAVEHQWPSASGPAGIHLLGSGRPFYDVESNVSSSGTDGRIMVTSDTSRFFHVGSAGTMLLGSSRMLSAGSVPVGGQSFYWAQEFGEVFVPNGNQQVVSFPNSGFSGKPFVYLSATTDIAPATIILLLRTVSATQFSFNETSGPVSKFTVNWLSIGTRVL